MILCGISSGMGRWFGRLVGGEVGSLSAAMEGWRICILDV